MGTLRLFIYLIFFWASLISYAQSETRPPDVLFHWTKYDVVNAMAKNGVFEDSSQLNFPIESRPSSFSSEFQKIADYFQRRFMFTWSHPVFGMKGGAAENYGPVPIAVKLKSNTRVLVISNKTSSKDLENLDLKNVDVILHKSSAFSEWIIVNPKSIEFISADPLYFKPLFKDILEKLKAGEKIPASLIHMAPKEWNKKKSEHYRQYAIEILENYLKSAELLLPHAAISPHLRQGPDLYRQRQQVLSSLGDRINLIKVGSDYEITLLRLYQSAKTNLVLSEPIRMGYLRYIDMLVEKYHTTGFTLTNETMEKLNLIDLAILDMHQSDKIIREFQMQKRHDMVYATQDKYRKATAVFYSNWIKVSILSETVKELSSEVRKSSELSNEFKYYTPGTKFDELSKTGSATMCSKIFSRAM